MQLDRRDFLGVGAACLLALRAAPRSKPLRIALLAPRAARPAALASALDGARFGGEEVAHTFALLRREVELVEDNGGDAIGVVSLLPDGSMPSAPLVVDARARARCDGSAAFRLGTARPDALLWHESLHRYGAQQLNERFRRRFGYGMDEHAWAGWFALKVIAEASLRARSEDPARLADWLLTPAARFDGHKGMPLRFAANGMLVQPTFRVGPDGIEHLQPDDPCAS